MKFINPNEMKKHIEVLGITNLSAMSSMSNLSEKHLPFDTIASIATLIERTKALMWALAPLTIAGMEELRIAQIGEIKKSIDDFLLVISRLNNIENI